MKALRRLSHWWVMACYVLMSVQMLQSLLVMLDSQEAVEHPSVAYVCGEPVSDVIEGGAAQELPDELIAVTSPDSRHQVRPVSLTEHLPVLVEVLDWSAPWRACVVYTIEPPPDGFPDGIFKIPIV